MCYFTMNELQNVSSAELKNNYLCCLSSALIQLLSIFDTISYTCFDTIVCNQLSLCSKNF